MGRAYTSVLHCVHTVHYIWHGDVRGVVTGWQDSHQPWCIRGLQRLGHACNAVQGKGNAGQSSTPKLPVQCRRLCLWLCPPQSSQCTAGCLDGSGSAHHSTPQHNHEHSALTTPLVKPRQTAVCSCSGDACSLTASIAADCCHKPKRRASNQAPHIDNGV